MFEYTNQKILCPAEGCKFINNLETVIIHTINSFVHMLQSAICKSFYNVSVLTHDCNVIKSQHLIHSFIKYYHVKPPPGHSQKNIYFRNHLYIETFEDWGTINYAMFMSITLFLLTTISVLTKRIIQR